MQLFIRNESLLKFNTIFLLFNLVIDGGLL